MSKIVQTHCPICDRTTAHEIYTTNGCGERGIERLLTAIVTVGFFELDRHRICECLSCGKKSTVNNNNGNLKFGM